MKVWGRVVLVVVAVLGVGCGSSSPPAAQRTATATARPKIPTPPPLSRPVSTPTPVRANGSLPQPSQRCGDPDKPAKTLHFTTEDGVTLDGAIVGKGATGAVLIHESPGPMCGWWPYANYLASHKVHALLFDLRCVGLSTCPSDGLPGNGVEDVRAAVQALKQDGAKSVALIGASMGGAIAVTSAAKLHPQALVDLSGERVLPRVHADGDRSAPHITAPALFVVAQRDLYTPVPDMRAVARKAASRTKQLRVLPAKYGHGWDMLVGDGGLSWSPLAAQVANFVKRHGS